MNSSRTKKISIFILMVILAIGMLYPFIYMLDNSFKSKAQFFGAPGHSTASWAKLFSTLPVGQQLINSTVVCLGAITIILFVSTLAGFAVAKLQSRVTPFIFLGIVGAMLIPLQSIIIPAYINASHLNLLSGYWGAILVYAALGTPFSTFLMTSYFRGLPDDLVEASVIQDPGYRTITVGLGALAAGRVVDIPVLLAGSLISAIPAIVVYLVFQRQLVSGLTAGIGK
jgi:ABC-type glycerol-3-phosphate transport system permease component